MVRMDGADHGSSTAERPPVGVAGWVAFVLTCVAYTATTTAEALLSPVYPAVSDELGFGLADAGVFFAVLAGAIAVATLVGGLLLHRFPAPRLASVSLTITAAGSLMAAIANNRAGFLAAQIAIGAGAGLLWPAAVQLVGRLVGPARRGLSMGIFGVAFSAGLVLAAGLAAFGNSLDWRTAFVVSAGLAAVAALAMGPVSAEPPTTEPLLTGVGSVIGLPSIVGVVAGVSQYATVSFLPVFAVDEWATSTATAALILVVGRVLSIPAKLVVGALADRSGPVSAVRAVGFGLGATGILWAVGRPVWLAMSGAAVFTALVSGLFPLANLLALERAGGGGVALGVFRALQIGAGAAVGLLLGVAANRYGLRPTIAVAVVTPCSLISIRRGKGAGNRGPTGR